jgi:hypothetical protein
MEEIGYEMIEITSSGMTHTCDHNFKGMCKWAMKINSPDYNKVSEINM